MRQRQLCPPVQLQPMRVGKEGQEDQEAGAGNWHGGGGKEQGSFQRRGLAVHKVRQRQLGEAAHLQHVQRAQVHRGRGEDGPGRRLQRARQRRVQGACVRRRVRRLWAEEEEKRWGQAPAASAAGGG